MPRPIPLSSPALSALKFNPEEESGSHIGPDGSAEDRSARRRPMGPSAIVELVDRFYRKRMVADAIAEYVPRMRERVCVEGRDEVFVVIYVDRKSNVADLVSTEQAGELLDNVAFSAIYPEPRKAA